MHCELNKTTKSVSFKTRLALIITGLVFFAILLGLIIWSSIMLSQVPHEYHKNDANYNKALTFGILNGFSDFIALVLIINISVYAYSIKIFKSISDFNKEKKEHKSLEEFESQPNVDIIVNELKSEDQQDVVR